ncbi:hypothetical protein SIPHO075v1_p0048 [Vibrio phage PS65A.1]|nr:hypothetical protein SIPHO075v1_p0048 [Vibrio phage PS65A.1]
MECDDCGEYKEDAVLTLCPYAQDVDDEVVEVVLCSDCYHERCQDI